MHTVHDNVPTYTFEACVSKRFGSVKEKNSRRGRSGSRGTWVSSMVVVHSASVHGSSASVVEHVPKMVGIVEDVVVSVILSVP